MPGYTMADVVTEVQRTYPGITTQEVVDYANVVHAELASRLPLYRVVFDIALVAGQSLYAASEGLHVFDDAVYRSSPSAYEPLIMVTTGELDVLVPGWRLASSGVPAYVYTEPGGVGTNLWHIGLYPPPSTSTGGSGFPAVRLWANGTETGPLTATSEIPKVLSSHMAYVTGVCYYYSLARDVSSSPIRAKVYNAARQSEVAYVAHLLRKAPRTVTHEAIIELPEVI